MEELRGTKMVLIGNGFDLAHDLKTSYTHFLDNLESKIIENNSQCGDFPKFRHWERNGIKDDWLGVKENNEGNYKLSANPHTTTGTVYFKELFESRNSLELVNWADLETFYFDLLIEYKNYPESIKVLNAEFQYMKELLEDYLINQVENVNLDNQQFNNHPILDLLLSDNLLYNKIYFVTFNYTSKVLDYYYHKLSVPSADGTPNDLTFSKPPIHIHGKLKDEDNPIIFGYGDENSADYQELEDALNDDLLVNFKTFQYLRTENYNTVLSLLEQSDNIDVQIIGHSCGLCDKALLRKIFQHENVKRIEAVYHGDDSNYFSKLFSISRIFDDNTLMREKVIPLERTRKI